MTPMVVGLLGIMLFLILLALKMPIAIAMALSGFIGISIILSINAAFRVLSSDLYTNFANYSLSVIPMFVLMGFFAFYAGMGSKLYDLAYKTIGHMRGGLAMSSELACAIFGAVCGSSTATAATIGSIAIPEMKKYGYNDSLSTASVASGGALGILIPPSTIFVIYGVATEQSIARLFLAGIIPGALLTLFYMAAIWIVTVKNQELGPPGPDKPELGKILNSLRGGLFEVIIVFMLSIGGLFAGWFTPTEAGGVGAAGVLIVTCISRKMTWKGFTDALADTTRTSAMILFLIGGAVIFTRFMALSRLPFELASWVSALPFSPIVIMIFILIVYLILGTFIEMIPLILLTIPIFFPVVINVLGYDPIWFGVIIVMVVAMGVITPPVGINVYVVKGVAKEVPLEIIFRGVWPFILAAAVCIALLIVFPEIATFLPDLLRKF